VALRPSFSFDRLTIKRLRYVGLYCASKVSFDLRERHLRFTLGEKVAHLCKPSGRA
jgi:hypothetical protein